MSNNKVQTEDKDFTPPSREQMLRHLNTAVQEALHKVEKGRVYDKENERVRIAWIKALSYAVNSYRKLLKDHDLAELAERVEKLEESQNAE